MTQALGDYVRLRVLESTETTDFGQKARDRNEQQNRSWYWSCDGWPPRFGLEEKQLLYFKKDKQEVVDSICFLLQGTILAEAGDIFLSPGNQLEEQQHRRKWKQRTRWDLRHSGDWCYLHCVCITLDCFLDPYLCQKITWKLLMHREL